MYNKYHNFEMVEITNVARRKRWGDDYDDDDDNDDDNDDDDKKWYSLNQQGKEPKSN